MGRKLRGSNQVGRFHVTNRGGDRRALFLNDADRVEFGRLLGVACERYEVSVIAYCLMDNHFHLVLDCPDGGLSPFVQYVTGHSTRHANERRAGDGPLVRGRFWSRPIGSDGDLLGAVRYVHRNPVAAGMVPIASSYRWSSHRAALGLKRSPVWLEIADVVAWAGGPAEFDRVIRGELETRSVEPTAFLAAVGQVVAEWPGDGEESAQRSTRVIAALALDVLDERSSEMLIDVLGYSSTSAVNQARRRARLAADEKPWLAQLLHRSLELSTPIRPSRAWRDRSA